LIDFRQWPVVFPPTNSRTHNHRKGDEHSTKAAEAAAGVWSSLPPFTVKTHK